MNDMTTIGAIADIFDGPHATPNKTEDGPYFLNIASLQNGRLVLAESAHLSDEDFARWTKRVTPQENDLLFSYETRLGEAALMPAGIKACLGRRMGLLRPKLDQVDPQFLLYSYLGPHFQHEIVANTITGATVDRIPVSEIGNFKLRIPKLSEQQRVATVLCALDAKIDLNHRINAELESLAKTIYDYWFVQFDFPDENGRPYKSSGGKMIYSAALKREIPEGWNVGSLNALGDIVGGSTPSTANPENFGRNMIPWITPKDLSDNKGRKFISRGETDVSEEGRRSASLKLYPAGTVLMSSRAPVGYLAIALNPLTTNQGFKSFVPVKGYDASFVFHVAARALPAIMQHASGSTFSEISAGVLKRIHTVLPPKSIADKFSNAVESLFARQKMAETESDELARLRDWLLPMLMNGQVKVA